MNGDGWFPGQHVDGGFPEGQEMGFKEMGLDGFPAFPFFVEQEGSGLMGVLEQGVAMATGFGAGSDKDGLGSLEKGLTTFDLHRNSGSDDVHGARIVRSRYPRRPCCKPFLESRRSWPWLG